MGLSCLVLNPVKIKNLNKLEILLEKMVKTNPLPKALIQQSSVNDLSKIESRLSALEQNLSKETSSVDFSSLPELASRKDDLLTRVNALEAKLQSLITLLSN